MIFITYIYDITGNVCTTKNQLDNKNPLTITIVLSL